MRIDKYIWSIRIFKTRALSTKACREGKVLLNNEISKASKTIKINDIVSVKETPIWRKYKVIKLPKSRIGAKNISEVVNEITSNDDLAVLNQCKIINKQNRINGVKGRPTKKERRSLDNFSN